MAPIQQRTRLSLDKKYEIIELIDRGVIFGDIMKRYDIGLRLLSSIKLKREHIIDFIKSNEATTSRSNIITKGPRIHKDLDRLLLQWYTRCTLKDIKITGRMIQQKARELNKELTGSGNFKATIHWLRTFKERHHLRKADIAKELETANQAAVSIFKAEFYELMQKEGYRLENVYNAESTGLLWKEMPKNTSLSNKVKTFEKKKRKKQVTLFLCANATGCHKLPALVLGSNKDPQTIEGFYAYALFVIYKTNSNAYMDSNIFNEWFNECFLKLVTRRQLQKGRREKTLLLLDNTGTDNKSKIISTKDEFVKIMYIPFDIAPLIQPMDRGIIACFKRMYRKVFLEALMPLSLSITEEDVIQVYSQLKMDACCRMVHSAWTVVENPILKNAWGKLLKNESEQSSEESEIIKRDINEALEKLNALPGCGGCDSIAVMNWFETDKEHNIDTQVDIQDTLLDFIDVAMDTEADKLIDENFEDILDDSSL